MTQLDDLLALLPDNDTGEIDAADLRTIVTALYTNDEALLSAVNSIDPKPGITTIIGTWQVNTLPGAPTAYGQLSTDTGKFSDASTVYLTVKDSQGVDLAHAINGLVSFFAQKQDDSAHWADFTVSGTINITYSGSPDTGYIAAIPVEIPQVSDGSTVDDVAWQTAALALRISPVGV